MPIDRVLETSLYVDDLEAATEFYQDVIGLTLLVGNSERHAFFVCGNSMVLLFSPERTRPIHGAEGAGHVAFAVDPEELDSWREKLKRLDIDIETDKEKAIYFRDPAGNSLEIAAWNLWDELL